METLYGNLQGLKSNQIKQLQNIYQQRLPLDTFTTFEFAQRLGAISTEIQQPISIYINRRGQIIRVGIGGPRQTQIPLGELPRYGEERLSGIRCLTTSLENETPKDSSLTSMVLQRLDALVTLQLTGKGFQKRGGGGTGYIEQAYIAHLLPKSEFNPDHKYYWTVSPPLSLDALTNQDFTSLVEGLEEEFRREYVAQQVESKQDRVILVGVMTQHTRSEEFTEVMIELARLVETAGGEVLETLEQKRSSAHPQTVVGVGKVEEIALRAQALGANLVVFDRDLSPTQIRNLELQIGARVVDRTEVILDIFAQRAQSRAGKLQVELAQLAYQLPRLVGRGQALSRLGGGIGTRGPGETKLETERRAIQRKISRLQEEVNQLMAHRARLRKQREKREVFSVAIVGYTNAGKSTLLNALTQSGVYAADQLFATLDPTTRRLQITNEQNGESTTVLLTDTVGFIHELPASLLDAFRATLEEVSEADAILHLVDLSHPAWESQFKSVLKILEEMPLIPGPMLWVFNKIDQVEPGLLEWLKSHYPDAVLISATNRLGLDELRQRLAKLVTLD
ncbi:MAG: GTPase HflX [Cyanobacteriota bacterium ELA615]